MHQGPILGKHVCASYCSTAILLLMLYCVLSTLFDTLVPLLCGDGGDDDALVWIFTAVCFY